MGCCISCIACNAASCLCSGACKCCGKVVPMSAIAGRVAYTILFFFISFIAWVFRSWAQNILKWVPVLKTVCHTSANDDEQVCFGTFAVYRISFVLALFHLILSAAMIGVKYRGDCRTGLQDGFWLIKIPLLLALGVAAFFIPNPFFAYYGWVALIASGIFILVQLILLVDFAHTWAENWIGKMEESEEGDNRWYYTLLGSTGVLYAFAITMIILMFVFFCRDAAKCQTNVAFVTMNIIFCLLLSFVSIQPRVQELNEKSGLLQAGVITAYATYLVWSGMMSDTGSCNPWTKSTSAASNVSVIIGAVFTIIALCYATIRAANNLGSADIEESKPLVESAADKEDKEKEVEKEEEERAADPDEPVPYHFSRFHFVFALGAMYLSMLMTDWHTVYSPSSSDTTARVDTGLAAVWVKVVSSWLCCALYLWTLVGPVLFPDREWK